VGECDGETKPPLDSDDSAETADEAIRKLKQFHNFINPVSFLRHGVFIMGV
jgi:hypothetical protein